MEFRYSALSTRSYVPWYMALMEVFLAYHVSCKVHGNFGFNRIYIVTEGLNLCDEKKGQLSSLLSCIVNIFDQIIFYCLPFIFAHSCFLLSLLLFLISNYKCWNVIVKFLRLQSARERCKDLIYSVEF